MELGNGVHQILPGIGPPQRAVFQIVGQILPQIRLILPVGNEAFRIVLIVGVCKCVGQIVGEFAQGIVLPDVPAGTGLKQLDVGLDIEPGIGEIVAPELAGPAGTFQIGLWIAIRLEGTEQEGQLVALGPEAMLTFQKHGCQEFVTAFLQNDTSEV